MKKSCFIAIVALLSFASELHAQSSIVENLKQHEYVLASDSLQGRRTGTIGAEKAVAYICRQLKLMNVRPFFDTSYIQPFTYGYDIKMNGKNVLALIPGADPVLKDEYILLGAHYDHLGIKYGDSTSDVVYNGADDNASGVAALLEVARKLQSIRETLKRSVIIAFFDAEEVGLEGSTYLADFPVVPMEKLRLMMSVDMVGYLKTSNFLQYAGTGTIQNGERIIHSLPWNSPYGKIECKKFENSIFTATDTRRFAQKYCPTLAVTTGLKSPYHKVSDEADGIDYEGLSYIVEHLTALSVQVSADESFSASGEVASIHAPQVDSRKPPFLSFAGMLQAGVSHINLKESELRGRSKMAYGLSGELYFQASRLFTFALGASYQSLGSGYTQSQSYRLHSVLVPLRLQYNPLDLNLGGDFRIRESYYVAPYYRYNFAAVLDNRETGRESSGWQQVVKDHQFGIAVGIQCIFGQHFLFDYHYSFDFTPMLSAESVSGNNGRNFLIGLGWLF